ncbi:Bax inhibitor-1/YccA family protein [Paracoccus sp. (in: a-proteobacteria)]|uniref:Bax inhibitor-1/YccA family protein n=1 Tax=Paracoccus sp. TaxID=267 RepID=UPI003A8B3556
MADYNSYRSTQRIGARDMVTDEGLRAYMNKVYGLMSVGLGVTAVAAYGISSAAVDASGQATQLGNAIYGTPLKWVITLAPLLVVFAFGTALNRLSVQGATMLFYGFAALMGLSISSIFLMYTPYSVVQTFLVTAISFAGLSLWGYTTRKDISGWGSFLIMGAIGLIVALLVNSFLQSPAMQFAISILGVLVFAGLTAYDTQRIKNTYLQLAGSDQEFLGKSAIMGALHLYLDFLNLFMFLLSFLGSRE